MTYNVLDVCRYVINYSNQHGYGISNLKLQKVLYFIQAYCLVGKENHEACFNDEIEAWDFGPVIPKAYHEYKQYGSGNIPSIEFYYIFDKDDIWSYQKIKYDDNIISEEDKKLINTVIEALSKFSATQLVSITHKQQPWLNTYKPYQNNVITREELKGYFNYRRDK